MNVSGGTSCFLATVVIFACAVSGQFTFTGFPAARKDYRHTVTCSYPGATSYKWRFTSGTYNGAVYTFTVDFRHFGLWECDAVVNGVTKTGKVNLLTYCDGVYVTSATTTNPSMGDPLDLSCKVLSPSGNRVQWSLTDPGSDRKAIASVSNSGCEYFHTENDNIKFATSTTCRPSTSNQFFNLNIKKVSTAHEGYWTCYDFGKSSCYSKPLRIAIAKPPKDPPTLTGFNNPIVGTNHSLTCDAWQLDVRPLTYTWYKDGVQISSGNTSTWRLQPVKKEVNGQYRCEVVDKVKNLKADAEDMLTVYYVATWNPSKKHMAETLAMIGSSVNLTIDILAYPLPTSIVWHKDKGSTTASVNYVTKKLSDTTWSLIIPSIRDGDYGIYEANVTNAAGSASFWFKLARPHIPDVPSHLEILVTGSNDLLVTFTPGFNGGAPQTFTIDYNVKDRNPQVMRGIKDLKDTRTVTYTIRHLLAGTTYYIKVKAVNEVGGSNFTETANITTAVEVTTRGNAVTAGETAGAIVSVILFVMLLAVVIVGAVMMKRMKLACFAGQGDTREPVLDNVLTDSVGGDAEKISNKAFTGETEPEYVNQPPEARGAAEPEYVNQPRQVRDSDAEVYEDVSSPNDTYADLDRTMMTERAVEDQPYESLEISEANTYM